MERGMTVVPNAWTGGLRPITEEGRNMKLEQLAPLVGTWEITGRTLDSGADNITGHIVIEPILDGHFLQLRGTMTVNAFEIESLELIWHDSASDTFAAHVYSSMSDAPIDYRWERSRTTLIHSGAGATYTGQISEDGTTITGGWRPDPGTAAHTGSAYDATMRRVK
jgi:hypothetical protein